MGGELQETSKKVDMIRSYTMQLVAAVQLVLAASTWILGHMDQKENNGRQLPQVLVHTGGP